MKARNTLFKALSLILAIAMILTVAGCAGGNSSSTSSAANESSTSSTSEEGGESGTSGYQSAGPDDTTEPYEFDAYYNYAGSVKAWGQDGASKFFNEKFNVTVNYSCPDADADSKMNLMISSDDLPDVVILDRNATWLKLIQLGYVIDINTLKYEGNTFDEDIPQSTQNMLSVDGGLYGVPNWARKAATGGNMGWIVNHNVYEELGSPDLNTLDDVHNFMLAAKEANLKTENGQDIIPFMPRRDDNGFYTYSGIYRSLGAPNVVESYWSQGDNTVKFMLKDEKMIEALKIANQWFNEGLIPNTTWTDNNDQEVEKLTNGRPAIAYYDFSQDDTNHFRTVLMENTDNTYDLLGYEIDAPIYPHGEGVDFVYGEEAGSVGWNVNCITHKAENPQRIFDLYSYMLTKEGSIVMMYGPQGMLWDELNEDGNPVLKKPESQFTSDEKDAAGCWFWSQPAHSDNVDLTKFAVNDMQPEDERSWVISIQAHVFTPDGEAKDGQKFMTDELTALSNEIDPNSDLGIARQAIQDECKVQLPQIIMASSEEEFNKRIQDLLDFNEANRGAEIEEIYTAKRQSNIDAQGYTAYQAYYDANK